MWWRWICQSEMLELAREHTAELSDIEFVRGSTEKLLARQLRADAVIINMVLHHTRTHSA